MELDHITMGHSFFFILVEAAIETNKRTHMSYKILVGLDPLGIV